VRTRVLVILACLAGIASVPSVELRAPVAVDGTAPGCVAALMGSDGTLRAIDPSTLEARAPIAVPPPKDPSRRAWLSGVWSKATAIMVEEHRGTITKIETHEAPTGTWLAALIEPPLLHDGTCDARDADPDELHALLASGEPPGFSGATGLPRPGPSEPNVFVAALSLTGVELWRTPIPARTGYYFPNLTTNDFYVLRPAAAISPDGRTIAVIHSELDGSDRLSLVDTWTHEVRTMPVRDGATLRFGPAAADAKMTERGKTWSPRFLDERYVYAVLHETRSDELGELSVLLIDTTDARIVARWPEHGVSALRAIPEGWTLAAGSIYVAAKDWSGMPHALYRLDAHDLRLQARRTLDTTPVLRAARAP
jgi:hypothetical protein